MSVWSNIFIGELGTVHLAVVPFVAFWRFSLSPTTARPTPIDFQNFGKLILMNIWSEIFLREFEATDFSAVPFVADFSAVPLTLAKSLGMRWREF